MATRQAAGAALLLLGLAGSAWAQTYPDRPIRFIVPYPAGGSTDIMARPVAQKLTEFLGQPVVVDYRPGASSIIGGEAAARANPDGYTLLFGGMTVLAMNRATFKKLPYDVDRDFAPIGLVGGIPLVLMSRVGLPANNVQELVAYAKARPGQVTCVGVGVGTSPHFGCVMLESMAGIKMTYVPYKGNGEANTGLLNQEVDISIGSLSPIQGLVKANKLKLLATGSPKRMLLLPNLPTVAETYPGFQVGTWFSLVTKAGTPNAIITRINHELNRILKLPEFRQQLEAGGYEPADGNGTPESLAKLIAEDTARWAKLAKEAKIETD